MSDPWDGAEPFVMLGEMRRCNGTTAAGGSVLHTQRCPLHGLTPEVSWAERDAAAERRGYEAAIAKLRDRGFNGAADYLETTKETTL